MQNLPNYPSTSNYSYRNSLPGAVVCADTVDTFKNRLDKFWQDQEVIFNWKLQIFLPGVEVKLVLF